MSEQTKLAVVTGGASGIGEACARRFAADGYRVVIADINAPRGGEVVAELKSKGHQAYLYVIDLGRDADVATFAQRVKEEHGVPDALVNSGGILQNAVRFLEMDMAEFDRIWQINVRSTVVVSREFGAQMCEAGSGSIINLCSLTTFRAGAQVGYAAGKASLKILTEIMAAEFGPKGVRVNAVAPGYTLTPAMQDRIDKGERNPEAVIERTALRRFISPAEAANAIAFLCSPDASAITGITLPIDAGWLATTAYQAYASQP